MSCKGWPLMKVRFRVCGLGQGRFVVPEEDEIASINTASIGLQATLSTLKPLNTKTLKP